MVKPVPDGYHTLIPYLNVKGANQAIEFYTKAFGAQERFRMPGPNGMIMHAELQIGDSILMLTEAMRDSPSVGFIFIYTPDVDAMWKRATEAGAKVKMPLANQFWGDRFGSVVDPFGNTWSMATHIEDVAPEEMARRREEAMKGMGGP